MALKKNSLAAALKGSTGTSSPTSAPANILPAAPAVADDGRTPSRIGKVQIAAFFDPEVSEQLKIMAVLERSTMQLLLAEALNDLFIKRGKPAIADVTDNRRRKV